MATLEDRFATASLTRLDWIAIVLALVTGAVHLLLGVGFLPGPLGVAFVLAAAGFFGAIVLVLLDYRRRLLYLLGIPYTGGQVVLWYALNRPTGVADLSTAEAVDKTAQVLLIVVLVIRYRRVA